MYIYIYIYIHIYIYIYTYIYIYKGLVYPKIDQFMNVALLAYNNVCIYVCMYVLYSLSLSLSRTHTHTLFT